MTVGRRRHLANWTLHDSLGAHRHDDRGCLARDGRFFVGVLLDEVHPLHAGSDLPNGERRVSGVVVAMIVAF